MWGVIRLIRWARVTHICVSKLTITGSDKGLPSRRQQAMIWTSAGIMLFGPLGTNFSEISIEMYTFLFEKMLLKMSSVKLWPFCLRLNVLMWEVFPYHARCTITARVASKHYSDVIMGAIASQITSLTIVYSTFYSDADQRKHQGSASLAKMANYA